MDKTVLITGGSRGIGAACARVFSRDGYRVVIGYNTSSDAAAAVSAETGAERVRADVSDAAQVSGMFTAAGKVDVLVCNAGIAMQKLFTDMTPEEWRHIFAVNVDGAFNCCREAIPGMIRRGGGSIIIVSSIWGVTGAACEAAYSASKAALIGLTKALAKELGPSGIRVNCVAPGVIDTEMNASFSEEDMAALRDETPLCRIGSPEEVAETIAFLASDRAGFITGQVISPNGGIVI